MSGNDKRREIIGKCVRAYDPREHRADGSLAGYIDRELASKGLVELDDQEVLDAEIWHKIISK